MAVFSENGVPKSKVGWDIVELGRALAADAVSKRELFCVEEFGIGTREEVLDEDLDKMLLIANFCESFIVR